MNHSASGFVDAHDAQHAVAADAGPAVAERPHPLGGESSPCTVPSRSGRRTKSFSVPWPLRNS